MKRETVWEDKNSKCVRTYNNDGSLAKEDVYSWDGNDKETNPERHKHRYANYNTGDYGMHGENVSDQDKKESGRSWSQRKK